MSLQERFLKHCFDIFFAGTVLLLTWPILLIVSIAIKCTSEGSIIFRQKRVGKRGRSFDLYKFRTMYSVKDSDSTVTVRGDKRITPLGAHLRRWKLDELPQFWNVLKGDLSVVGPRPDVPGYADKLKGDDRIILTIRPGVTGPATLRYRNEEEILAQQPDPERYNDEVIFPDKVRINREYIQNYHFAKDIKYIIQTALGLDTQITQMK
ncbi:UDP-glucose:undecaprenyl-phosphate glucose-1-phosphate transferase [subsurface metagenome]